MSSRIETMQQVARDAGSCLRSYFGRHIQVDNKGAVDLVTAADRDAETLIISGILRRHADDAILGEETGAREGRSSYKWIIDPLDGTTNFAHHHPHFAVSIALACDDRIEAGIVYDPIKEEMFMAHKGQGASLNGKPICVSTTDTLANALCVSGFSYDRRQRLPLLLSRVERALLHAQGFRRLGAAALDLAYVACGRLDVFWEDGLNAWDMAAGSLIATEAGARVTLLDGSTFHPYQGEVLACNENLHPQTIACILNPQSCPG